MLGFLFQTKQLRHVHSQLERMCASVKLSRRAWQLCAYLQREKKFIVILWTLISRRSEAGGDLKFTNSVFLTCQVLLRPSGCCCFCLVKGGHGCLFCSPVYRILFGGSFVLLIVVVFFVCRCILWLNQNLFVLELKGYAWSVSF